jgi:hypothetical protein
MKREENAIIFKYVLQMTPLNTARPNESYPKMAQIREIVYPRASIKKFKTMPSAPVSSVLAVPRNKGNILSKVKAFRLGLTT